MMLGMFGDDQPWETRPRGQTPARPGRPSGKPTRRLPEYHEDARRTRRLDDEDEWVQQAGKPQLDVWSIRELVQTINDEPDTYPHIVVWGPTRSGKTTLAQLIAVTRPGKVLILDPKRPRGFDGPKWGGLPYVARDVLTEGQPIELSYRSMVAALTAAVRTMEERYRQQEEMTEAPEQLTVIIDEAKDVVDQCPEVAALYRRILTIGAEARVRLILLSTTDRARKLGFDGEADSLDGFVQIRLGEFARRVLPEVAELSNNPRQWAVARFDKWVPFDTSRVRELTAKAPVRPSRAWRRAKYNCQVEGRANRLESSNESAAQQAHYPRAVSAKLVLDEPATGVTKPIEAPPDLLAELLRVAPRTMAARRGNPESVNNNADGKLAETPKVSTEAGNSFRVLSDAVSQTFRAQRDAAAYTVRSASSEERRKLRETWKLFTDGAGKQDALMRGFGLERAGRGYVRAKELFDAYKFLEDHGQVKKN